MCAFEPVYGTWWPVFFHVLFWLSAVWCCTLIHCAESNNVRLPLGFFCGHPFDAASRALRSCRGGGVVFVKSRSVSVNAIVDLTLWQQPVITLSDQWYMWIPALKRPFFYLSLFHDAWLCDGFKQDWPSVVVVGRCCKGWGSQLWTSNLGKEEENTSVKTTPHIY